VNISTMGAASANASLLFVGATFRLREAKVYQQNPSLS
jgi:hypothetical protein